MTLRGTDALISVATTTGGTYNTVDGISGFKVSHKGNNIDITIIGADFIRRMQGLKDASYSLSGFYEPTDTNGQVRIHTAWLNNSALFIKVLPDGTNGFKQEVKVDSFDTDGEADGAQEVSIELSGSDAMTAMP